MGKILKWFRKGADKDRLVLKLYIAFIVLCITFVSALVVSWFFSIDLNTVSFWLGAFIAFASFYTIFVVPVPWKIILIFMWIAVISFFLFQVFALTVFLSILGGIGIVILMLSVYLVL